MYLGWFEILRIIAAQGCGLKAAGFAMFGKAFDELPTKLGVREEVLHFDIAPST
jgi:hypothetical protein